MGFKESYAKGIEMALSGLDFRLGELKVLVEKKGLGQTPEWTDLCMSLKEEMDEVYAHLKFLRSKKNPKLIRIAKYHIEALLEDLGNIILRNEREYSEKG